MVSEGVKLVSREGVVGGTLGTVTDVPATGNSEAGEDLAERGGDDWGILTTRRWEVWREFSSMESLDYKIHHNFHHFYLLCS